MREEFMNVWKERLIQYIKALDDAILPEKAAKLIVAELMRIKQEMVAIVQEHSIENIVDNGKQLNKSIQKNNI